MGFLHRVRMLTNNMNCHYYSSQKFILAFHQHFTEITQKKGFGELRSTRNKIIEEMSRRL